MADDKSKKGPRDASRINVNEEYELQYWTKELNVSPEELKKAVQQVGPMVADVKKYFVPGSK